MIGSFSIGNAAPHLGSIFGAKGAAAEVFDTIDNVCMNTEDMYMYLEMDAAI